MSEQKPKMSVVAALAIILTGIGLVVFLAVFSNTSRPRDNADYQVTYDVVGEHTNYASLTYSNASGGTEQVDEVRLPWSKSFTASYGEFLYLSAQNKDEQGSITIYITVNGNPIKTATSSGAYTIATASDRCCR
jgi:Mycobacterium membrane protein